MTTILFDTNAYDALALQPEARERVRALCERGVITVVATSTIVDELADSPMQGLPAWFPVTEELDGIAVIGHSRIGHARIGVNDIYEPHLGESNQVADAVIAESAERYADILVSDDVRCRSRFAKLTQKCEVLTTAEFVKWLDTVS
jgi:hypothetical protein